MSDYYRKSYYQNPAVAESYDRERFAHRRGIERDKALRSALARALKLIPGVRSILDLPCGTGRLTGFFTERCYKYFGSDIAHEMLSVLTDQQPPGMKTALLRCDGEAIALKENAVDCVAGIRLFQLEIPDDVKLQILKEMRRVSRQWLIIEHMYVGSMRSFGKLRYSIYKWCRRERQLPVMDPAVLAAGWHEYRRVPLKGMKNWVGIYRKDALD
jgi:ubiquinone/menaquinone biosynthesis C-methylase UbiE